MMPAVAAHRGWHAAGAHENSIAALERAVAGGVDFVEIDVQRLRDGTLVVHHDPQLGGRDLAMLDRSALSAHPEVATLDDWSRRAGQLGASVLAETKGAGYEREMLAALDRYVPTDRVRTMSFNPDAVRALHELAPDRPTGLLSDVQQPARAGADLVSDARRAGASFLGLNVGQATDDVLGAAARAGLDVAVWTVNDADDLTRLIADPRVGTVITDAPDLALGLRLLQRAATRH